MSYIGVIILFLYYITKYSFVVVVVVVVVVIVVVVVVVGADVRCGPLNSNVLFWRRSLAQPAI